MKENAPRTVISDGAALDALLDKSGDVAAAPAALNVTDAQVEMTEREGVTGLLAFIPLLDSPESTGKSIIFARGRVPKGKSVTWRGREVAVDSTLLSFYTRIRK